MISFPDFVENSLALKVMSAGIVSLIKIGGVIERSNSSRANGSNRKHSFIDEHQMAPLRRSLVAPYCRPVTLRSSVSGERRGRLA